MGLLLPKWKNRTKEEILLKTGNQPVIGNGFMNPGIC